MMTLEKRGMEQVVEFLLGEGSFRSAIPFGFGDKIIKAAGIYIFSAVSGAVLCIAYWLLVDIPQIAFPSLILVGEATAALYVYFRVDTKLPVSVSATHFGQTKYYGSQEPDVDAAFLEKFDLDRRAEQLSLEAEQLQSAAEKIRSLSKSLGQSFEFRTNAIREFDIPTSETLLSTLDRVRSRSLYLSDWNHYYDDDVREALRALVRELESDYSKVRGFETVKSKKLSSEYLSIFENLQARERVFETLRTIERMLDLLISTSTGIPPRP